MSSVLGSLAATTSLSALDSGIPINTSSIPVLLELGPSAPLHYSITIHSLDTSVAEDACPPLQAGQIETDTNHSEFHALTVWDDY